MTSPINHARTFMRKVTEYSRTEDIKREYGHQPFEGYGFIPGGKSYNEDSITWTEIRPICCLNNKDKLVLMGGVMYDVDKQREYYGVGYGSAYYTVKKSMTPDEYKQALKDHREELKKQAQAKKEQHLAKKIQEKRQHE